MSVISEFLENESVKPYAEKAVEYSKLALEQVKDVTSKTVLYVCGLDETCATKISRSYATVRNYYLSVFFLSPFCPYI